jgi:DNA modification methylase
MKLYEGDCLEVLKQLETNSIHAVITDPPYGLAFMNKKWDHDVPSVEIWREVLRVLKPGGHLLSFGGTRTYHRMVVNIEDAGFEIRDQIQWIYGSGFPKSHNIKDGDFKGWGTALKPANEPICLARKPLEKGLTVAENVLKYGCGAINIDESRVGTSADMNPNDFDDSKRKSPKFSGKFNNGEVGEFRSRVGEIPNGRWPANLMFDEIAAEMLDEQVSETMKMHGAGNKKTGTAKRIGEKSMFGISFNGGPFVHYDFGEDNRKASRFFYVAKASASERNAGLEGMPEIKCGMLEDDNYPIKTGAGNLRNTRRQNHHPTVKPIKLMEYLCKLITPPNGIVLDPFMGSGSTGVAALNLGFDFIGIEKEPEYLEIATKRINKNTIQQNTNLVSQ